MIIFTPLAGSGRSTIVSPLAYLLQIDDVRILLDCGAPSWNADPGSTETLNQMESYFTTLASVAPTIDLVLFSHGDLAHMGLYAYAHTHWNLKAPGYCSLPVQAMGRMAVAEDVASVLAEEDGSQFMPKPPKVASTEQSAMEVDTAPPAPQTPGKRLTTLDQVQTAFDSLNTLRYSEPTHLGGKCQGLTITPYSSGHTIGGTIWKIRSPSSGTIVYAVNMNHTKERHLDGTTMLRPANAGGGIFEPLARPDVFITDAERSLVVTPRRKDRDSVLLDVIEATLRSSHSVLMPCDASTRVLELLVLLDQYWTFSKLKSVFPICMVSKTGQEMLAFVRSMLEWMGSSISKEEVTEVDNRSNKRRRRDDEDDDETTIGPVALRFRNIEIFATVAAFTAAYPASKPKVILAVPPSLSHGPSRNLLVDFASTPGNTLLLTSLGDNDTLSRRIFSMWDSKQPEGSRWGQGKVGGPVELNQKLKIKINSKVPLEGAELETHLQKERIAQEKEAVQRAALARSQRMLEADEVESDSDSDDTEDELAVDDELNDDGQANNQTNGQTLAPSERAVRTGGLGLDWADEDSGARQVSYDIYLKGNISKTTTFFKTSAGQSQRFRMFPYVERKRRVDEYGETLDVAAWLRKGKALEADAETEEVKELRRKKNESDAKKAAPEPPSKFTTQEVELNLACRVLYVDLEGLNDGRAVKTIVPQVNPRKMILVNGSSEATDALIQSCASIRAMTQEIFAPSVGQDITIGQHTNTFAISLGDSLLSSVKMSQFEDNEIAFVYGRVNAHSNNSIPTLEPVPVASRQSNSELNDGTSKQLITALPRTTLIGDLRLTALRAKLTSLGLSAEFAGEGVLICSGGGTGEMEQIVAVRKTGRGKLSVEGTTGDVYFSVRKEVYGLHALVAAYA